MKPFYLLAFLLSTFLPLHAQDTLSFGGIYELPGAEVRATYTPVSPLAQSFTIEEIYRLPGTFYDPARLVALLPGVVQTNDQANHLSVRGNTPNANLWRLNGLAIVNPNHTANAGTFYDFPTLSGGGINAISAQMLDNSGFLAGGLPVEYGFATGGTFDLRLRPGSKTKQKYQAQAGFIGFDLMAEGPIGSSGQTSYLVNGRYSFTGLLADMGVDFGGEEIRFADFNGHLHHQWDGGGVSLFLISGQSSNNFTAPDPNEEELTEQKELFNIDYSSNLNIVGLSLEHRIGQWQLTSGAAFSATNTERDQTIVDASFNSLNMQSELQQLHLQQQVERIVSNTARLTGGIEFLSQRLENQLQLKRGLESPEANVVALFAGYRLITGKSDLSFGVRAESFSGTNLEAVRLLPRFAVKHYSGNGKVTVSLEGLTGMPLNAMSINGFGHEVNVPVTWQGTIGYGRKIGALNVQATAFAQFTPAENAIRRDFSFISMNSFLEFDPDYALTTTTATRRTGIELEVGGGRKTEGWYYRGSLTVLDAQTEQPTGDFTKDKYAVDFIGKLILGREWAGKDRKEREHHFGINLALITNGGERYGIVEPYNGRPGTINSYFATPRVTEGFINRAGTYFRPDLRLYKTKTRPKTTTTLALDIQNVAGIENVGNVYYDAFLERPTERLQLGLIPVLSYRISWR